MSFGDHPDHLDGFISTQMFLQETEEKTQIWRRRPCEDGQRLERFSCEPVEFWSHQKLNTKEGFPKAWGGDGPNNTLTLDLLASRTVN